MRHNWIFDVLADLVTYAEKNDLPRLAEKATDALRQAEADLGKRSDIGQGDAMSLRRGRGH